MRVLTLRCWQMSLSWKVLPSWLLQLKGLRPKDDRIYTAQDKHFSSDISCRNYKLCTAVLYFLYQKSPQLPRAPPAASPSLLSCQGWSPDPALQLQDHRDVIPGGSSWYIWTSGQSQPGKGGIYNTWKTEVLKAQHSCYQTRDQQLLILGKPIAPFLQENLDKTGRNRRKTGQMKIAWAL